MSTQKESSSSTSRKRTTDQETSGPSEKEIKVEEPDYENMFRESPSFPEQESISSQEIVIPHEWGQDAHNYSSGEPGNDSSFVTRCSMNKTAEMLAHDYSDESCGTFSRGYWDPTLSSDSVEMQKVTVNYDEKGSMIIKEIEELKKNRYESTYRTPSRDDDHGLDNLITKFRDVLEEAWKDKCLVHSLMCKMPRREDSMNIMHGAPSRPTTGMRISPDLKYLIETENQEFLYWAKHDNASLAKSVVADYFKTDPEAISYQVRVDMMNVPEDKIPTIPLLDQAKKLGTRAAFFGRYAGVLKVPGKATVVAAMQALIEKQTAKLR